MQFKIISGTTIHEYAERVRHGHRRARPHTDHGDLIPTKHPNLERGQPPCSLDELKGLAELEARRMMRPIKADGVAGLKAEGLGASEVARRLKIGRASI